MFKTYVMHYKPLKERKESIKKELSKKNIVDYEFIEDYDKEDLTDDIIIKYYNSNTEEASRKAKITLLKNNIDRYDSPDLSLASISLCMKHILAMRKFTESEYDIALMLEDDCFFYDNSISIELLMSNAPHNWDVIFIGGAFGHNVAHPSIEINGYLLSSHPSTNTTSSFLIRKHTATKTLKQMHQFSLPIDWELNYNFNVNGFNVYHTNPYIATQISGKTFKSTVHR